MTAKDWLAKAGNIYLASAMNKIETLSLPLEDTATITAVVTKRDYIAGGGS